MLHVAVRLVEKVHKVLPQLILSQVAGFCQKLCTGMVYWVWPKFQPVLNCITNRVQYYRQIELKGQHNYWYKYTRYMCVISYSLGSDLFLLLISGMATILVGAVFRWCSFIIRLIRSTGLRTLLYVRINELKLA